MKKLAKIPRRALNEADFGFELRLLGYYGQVDREDDEPDWWPFDVAAISAQFKTEPEIVIAANRRLMARGYLDEQVTREGDVTGPHYRLKSDDGEVMR